MAISTIRARKEMIHLTHGMQRQMDKHTHSHGEAWKVMSLPDLMVCLLKDAGELAFYIKNTKYPAGSLKPKAKLDLELYLEDIEDKTCDIANICWMLRERARLLAAPLEEDE